MVMCRPEVQRVMNTQRKLCRLCALKGFIHFNKSQVMQELMDKSFNDYITLNTWHPSSIIYFC